MPKKIYYYKDDGENNIPESYQSSVTPRLVKSGEIWRPDYHTITQEEYGILEKEGKLLYSVDGKWFVDNSGVFWNIRVYSDGDIRVYTSDRLPRSTIKLWGDKEEFQEYRNKVESLKKKKDEIYKEKQETLKDLSFSFYTPRMIVKEIIKPTKKVPVSIGDIIHGEIKVIEGGRGFLHGTGRLANYIDVYINGTQVNRLPMTSFQNIFLENLRVEILGYSYLEP